MFRKIKSILKIVVPVAIVVQLTTIIFLLREDNIFNCRMYAKGAIACREIKMWYNNRYISVTYGGHKTSFSMSVSPNIKKLDKILDLLYNIVT